MAKYYPGEPTDYNFRQLYKDGVIGTRDVNGNLVLTGEAASSVLAATGTGVLPLVVPEGDSWAERNWDSVNKTTHLDFGIINWALAKSGRKLKIYNPLASKGGTTTAEWLPGGALRTAAWPLGTPKSRVWVFLGTNDISTDVPAGDENTPGTIIYNLKRIYDWHLAYGNELGVVTIPPYGSTYVVTGADLATKNANRAIVNAFITRYAAANPRVKFFDQYAAIINPTNTFGYAFDIYNDETGNTGIHTSAAGAEVIGTGLAVAGGYASLPDAAIHASSYTDSFDYNGAAAKNKLSNPMFIGSAANGGTVGAGTTVTATALASGWFVDTTAGTATVVCTQPARTVANNGDAIGNNQRLTITGAGNTDSVTFRTGSIGARFVAGTKIQAEVYIDATNLNSVKGIRLTFTMTATVAGVPTTFTYSDLSFNATTKFDQSSKRLLLQTEVLQIPAGATLSSSIFSVVIAFNGASGTATVDIGRPSWREVV